MRIPLAVLHLLALAIGFGALFARARAANRLKTSAESLKSTFFADNLWGLAAILWLSTGLWRALGSYEKANSYYWGNHVFLAKMGFFVMIVALEAWPAFTLVMWRRAAAKGTVEAGELAWKGRTIARISAVQLLLLVATVTAAVMMARGYGAS